MAVPDVDVAALQLFLSEFLSADLRLNRLNGGDESAVFLAETPSQRLVVRVALEAEGYRKDSLVANWLAGTAVPVPAVLRIGAWGGFHVCITEYIDGDTVQSLDAEGLSPVVRSVAETLQDLRRFSPPVPDSAGPLDSEGRCRFRSWPEYLAESTSAARQTRWGDSLNPKAWMLVARLSELAPDRRGLVHGDFGSNNLLTDGKRITGVLDWSEAMIGDPLYDVANQFFWRTWLACMEAQARLFEEDDQFCLSERDMALVHAYQLHIGLRQLLAYQKADDQQMCTWTVGRINQLLSSAS
ncbi:hypothetical protein GCM10007989_00990 [Devosia pacifica]|uniref:Aminoglycoside phosphotransferase domain-containing protein n=1 Tax=Devosia pacifica TaxID=1335967 RepID=A0A918RU71_9HYPH|nr:aminoglycoside phosphotransferase family protein [Devosia pacifica]GHA10607.1 hypothetical protein GCM10007989_00990 [Devosia pacifica]